MVVIGRKQAYFRAWKYAKGKGMRKTWPAVHFGNPDMRLTSEFYCYRKDGYRALYSRRARARVCVCARLVLQGTADTPILQLFGNIYLPGASVGVTGWARFLACF